jgi:hypothetical protein
MSRTTLFAVCFSTAWCWAAGTQLAFETSADGEIHFHSAKHSLLQAASTIRHKAKVTPIPWQLVMTGKAESLEQLPSKMQANFQKTLALNPGIKVQYFSDRQCRMYVRQHCGDKLADMYIAETQGQFRGDICRAAVLFQEGGFYADLDLEPTAPFQSLVDDSTKFMSVFTRDGAILNALMATVPGSPIMKKTLGLFEKWYEGDRALHDEAKQHGQWMGTVTIRVALGTVMQSSCPQIQLDSKRQGPDLQWKCGDQDFRFYHEDRLNCNHNTLKRAGAGTAECPYSRMSSSFDGLHYGIFKPGTGRELVAWSRTAACDSWWCGGR